MTTSEWFSTKPTPGDRRTAFLRALAAAAEQWAFADLSPENTSTDLELSDGRVVVQITVPGLTSKRGNLRVLYRPDVEGRPVLQSAWSDTTYSFDDYEDPCGGPDEDVDLWVSGVDASPEQCGAWTAAWFERQLRRRVTRREWDRPPSGLSTLLPSAQTPGPVAVEWLVESPDGTLDSRGGFTWWWLMRRPPSRVVVERPGAGPQV